MYRIAVIPGDGIDKTVVPEAVRVLESTSMSLIFQYLEVGYEVFKLALLFPKTFCLKLRKLRPVYLELQQLLLVLQTIEAQL